MDNNNIVFRINTLKKRRDFLRKKKGFYTVTNLDMKYVEKIDFNDGNNYSFHNCILKNTDLCFNNVLVKFVNCSFDGSIYIQNNNFQNGAILIEEGYIKSHLDILSITSPIVAFNYNRMEINDCVVIHSNHSCFNQSTLYSPSIYIDEKSACTIIDSTIVNIKELGLTEFSCYNSDFGDEFPFAMEEAINSGSLVIKK